MRPPGKMRQGLLQLIDDLARGNVMVEVGSWVGESTEMFALSGKFKHIFAVDSWNGDESIYCEPLFDDRIKKYSNVYKYKLESLEALSFIRQADFVYLDGDHRYEYFKSELHAWSLITPIIGGHDYGSPKWKGVKQAVDEIFGKPDKIYEDRSWIKKLV